MERLLALRTLPATPSYKINLALTHTKSQCYMAHPPPHTNPLPGSSPFNDALVAAVFAAVPLLIVLAGVQHVVNDPGLKLMMQQHLPAPEGSEAAAAAAAAEPGGAAPAPPKLRTPAATATAALERRLEALEALVRRQSQELAAAAAATAATTASAAAPPSPPPTAPPPAAG